MQKAAMTAKTICSGYVVKIEKRKKAAISPMTVPFIRSRLLLTLSS